MKLTNPKKSKRWCEDHLRDLLHDDDLLDRVLECVVGPFHKDP